MVDSLDEFKSSRSVCGKNFPNFEMLDAKIASALNKTIQNPHFKKKATFEEQKVQKKDRFLRGRQIALMIYDYFRVAGAHDTVLDYADFFLCYSSWWQHSGIRYRMGRSFIICVKDTIRWCSRKSVQIENTWVWTTQNRIGIVRDGDSSEDIDAQLSNIENDGEKKYRSEIPMAKLWRQTRENRNSGYESQGVKWRWKRKTSVLSVERKRPVFEGRPAVSGMRVMIVHQNRHRKPLLPLSHQWHEVEALRGIEASDWQDSSTTVQVLFDRYLHEHPPEWWSQPTRR